MMKRKNWKIVKRWICSKCGLMQDVKLTQKRQNKVCQCGGISKICNFKTFVPISEDQKECIEVRIAKSIQALNKTMEEQYNMIIFTSYCPYCQYSEESQDPEEDLLTICRNCSSPMIQSWYRK